MISSSIAKRLHVLILSAVLAVGLLAFAPATHVAHADNGSAICTVQADASKNIGTCINRIYTISLYAGGIIAVLLFVIAGYLYISGDQKTAKGLINSAIVGLIVLFSAFLFLNTINPDLTTFSGLSLPPVTCGDASSASLCTAPSSSLSSSGGTGTTGTGTGGGAGNGSCSPATSSAASPSALQTIFGSNATNASIIAQAESSGNPGASGDTCENDGNNASIGLFQINISANSIPASVTGNGALSCPMAFTTAANASSLDPATKDYKCSVKNQTLYDQCTAAMEDPVENAKMAAVLSNNGSNWSPWSTHTKCGL